MNVPQPILEFDHLVDNLPEQSLDLLPHSSSEQQHLHIREPSSKVLQSWGGASCNSIAWLIDLYYPTLTRKRPWRFYFGRIRTHLRVIIFPSFLIPSFLASSHVNFLLVRNHQAETNIAKLSLCLMNLMILPFSRA